MTEDINVNVETEMLQQPIDKSKNNNAKGIAYLGGILAAIGFVIGRVIPVSQIGSFHASKDMCSSWIGLIGQGFNAELAKNCQETTMIANTLDIIMVCGIIIASIAYLVYRKENIKH